MIPISCNYLPIPPDNIRLSETLNSRFNTSLREKKIRPVYGIEHSGINFNWTSAERQALVSSIKRAPNEARQP